MPATLVNITKLAPPEFIEVLYARPGYFLYDSAPYGGICLQVPQRALDAPTAEDRAIRQFWKTNEKAVAELARADRRTCHLGPKPGNKGGDGGKRTPHAPAPHHRPTSGLRKPTQAPQKIGHDRHGKPLPKPVVTPPAPEEPPFILPYRGGLVDVNGLSAAELQREVESICTEHRILQGKLARLGEAVEGEPFEVWQERQRAFERLGFIQRRAQQIGERQERELDQRIASFAREQRLRKDGGTRRAAPGWHFGRHPSA